MMLLSLVTPFTPLTVVPLGWTTNYLATISTTLPSLHALLDGLLHSTLSNNHLSYNSLTKSKVKVKVKKMKKAGISSSAAQLSRAF